jgi:hypothetical protein
MALTPKNDEEWLAVQQLLADMQGGESQPLDQLGCSARMVVTDLDLAPIARTHANMWEAMYFQSRCELVKANRGIRRLKKRLAQFE